VIARVTTLRDGEGYKRLMHCTAVSSYLRACNGSMSVVGGKEILEVNVVNIM
jgi:hypothetical protein